MGYFGLSLDCTDDPDLTFRVLETATDILTLPIDIHKVENNNLTLVMRADCSITTPQKIPHSLYVEATAFDGYFNDSSYQFEILIDPRIVIMENQAVEYRLLSDSLAMNLVYQDVCSNDFWLTYEGGADFPDFVSFLQKGFPIEMSMKTSLVEDLGDYNISLFSNYYNELHSYNTTISVVNPNWNYYAPYFIQSLTDLEIIQGEEF